MKKEKKKVKWETPGLIKFDRKAVGNACNAIGGGETCLPDDIDPGIVVADCISPGSQQLLTQVFD